MSKLKLNYTIRELEARVPLSEYLVDCVDVPRFLAYCEACPNFGTVWSCPSYDFDPMEVWNRYGDLRLYARMLIPDSPGQDEQAALFALREEKDKYLDILFNWEVETPGSLALAAGSCTLCAPCTRPSGRPCQKPEQMRYSIDSLGGDVGLTASRYFGYPLQWIQDDILPDYLMLVGGLLIPHGKVEPFVE
jgi:predicted metal-binding protein